jgi:hypothetical protein
VSQALHPRWPAGDPRGGRFAPKGQGGRAGAKHGDLTHTTERALHGSGGTLSKQETGQLGEQLAVRYLKGLGFRDARVAETARNNFAVDLVEDHHAYEIKAGLAGVSRSAQQWRATIGQPGKQESAWLARASAAAKLRWNDRKRALILARKQAAVQELARRTGRAVEGRTMALIIDHRRRIVDVHVFDGFHLRIGWNSPQAARAYRGSFKY